MSKDVALKIDFKKITTLIAKARVNALKTVNKELINLYLEVGKYISEKVNTDNWEKSVVKKLSEYVQNQFQDIRGFSPQNIWRMKQFFETHLKDPKLSPLVREISWTNNLIIFSKCKAIEEREFYILLSARERLSRRELERQINSGVFERTMLANKSVSSVVAQTYPELENILLN